MRDAISWGTILLLDFFLCPKVIGVIVQCEDVLRAGRSGSGHFSGGSCMYMYNVVRDVGHSTKTRAGWFATLQEGQRVLAGGEQGGPESM